MNLDSLIERVHDELRDQRANNEALLRSHDSGKDKFKQFRDTSSAEPHILSTPSPPRPDLVRSKLTHCRQTSPTKPWSIFLEVGNFVN